MTADLDALLRPLAPQVLATLVRRHGGFDECEDAVQEALIAATVQWPTEGVPDSPRGWLITVAGRRLADHQRSEIARRRREETIALRDRDDEAVVEPTEPTGGDHDDTLTLLFLCCHPSLTPVSQVALTLRAVGGLSTAEIARAFLGTEATMAQRISRAKQRIRASHVAFRLPPAEEQPARLRVVLHVLYLIFNEGYATTAGPDLQRADLTAEAIRLTREVHRLRPDDAEVSGLLALMLLTEARRTARTDGAGDLVPLAEQDRSRWDAALVAEGVALLTASLPHGPTGPYQLQAAIAALHDEAARPEDTDWPQILALYDLLAQLTPTPMVQLSRAVAVAMVSGPAAGLAALDRLADDDRLADSHRVEATRAHLLERAGDPHAAAAYRRAAGLTTSDVERRYLLDRANRVTPSSPASPAPPG